MSMRTPSSSRRSLVSAENSTASPFLPLIAGHPYTRPEWALGVFSQVGFLWLVTYFFRVSAWSVLLVIGCGFP
ncbi:hypothetical protein, partial [Bifidobacterium subtile]|uniref:hypothetical protein n=1 Tax=Bifidobacterium subtile TaxID=77635 RepID=UPI001B7FA77F